MKFVIIFALAVACALAASPPLSTLPISGKVAPAAILKYSNEPHADGGYVFSFESDNGIIRQEQGDLKQVLNEEGKEQLVVVQSGVYSYPGEDGKPIEIRYTADENGFHAEGDSIPKNV